jgi:sec-independent protein translocase protein TatA
MHHLLDQFPRASICVCFYGAAKSSNEQPHAGKLLRHGGLIMFGSLGMGELLIILVIVILIFGVNKIPQLGKGLGEGIRNFKSALKEAQAEPEDKSKKA